MKVTIAEDDFLNECYGLDREFPDFEIPTEFIGDYDNVAETPIDINHDEESFEQMLNSIESNYNNKVDFKDIGYSFEVYRNEGKSRLFTTITNQDFWFNFHKNKSILTIIESEIIQDKYIDILQDKTIQEFFLENLSSEIERIDQLELFNSFLEFIPLQQLFTRFESNIWCKEIFQLYESIKQKLVVKKDQFCNETEYKLIAQTILINRTDDEQKHLNRIKTLIYKLSDQERQSLFLSIKSLFGLRVNAGDGEIQFFKKQNLGYYSVASTMSLYHFKKLFDFFSINKSKEILINSGVKRTVKPVFEFSPVHLDRKTFTKELLNLVNVTAKQNNQFKNDEIDVISHLIMNLKKFNPDKPEIIKFNNWLVESSNLHLFQLFLGFISSNSFKIIPSGSYQKLSMSISSKFNHRGLGHKNLLNTYINSADQKINLNDSNKSNFAFIKNELLSAEKNLQNGIVKKMISKIISNL